MNYIKQLKTKGCILCKIKRQNKDKENFIIYHSDYCFAVLNIFPYNNGHVMIVPNRHVGTLEKLNDFELLDMNKTLIKIKKTLKKILKPEGFNIGINIGKASGAGIEKHIHTHLVPRWQGDTNFMPILSATKIISQSLEELYLTIKKII